MQLLRLLALQLGLQAWRVLVCFRDPRVRCLLPVELLIQFSTRLLPFKSWLWLLPYAGLEGGSLGVPVVTACCLLTS
jgi:hypothetical protein